MEVLRHPAAPELEALGWTSGQLQGSERIDAQEHAVFNFLAFLFQVLAFIGQRRSCLEGSPVCHLNPGPALGCEGWRGGVGRPL